MQNSECGSRVNKLQQEIVDLTSFVKNLGEGELKILFAQLILNTPDPAEKIILTRMFLGISALIEPDSIEGFLGIKIVERMQDRPRPDDCFTYFFGQEADAKKITDEMTKKYKMSKEPMSGTYALYLDEDLNPKHIGKVTKEGKVISKWGLAGHVYEHPPILVPISYGPHIAYFLPFAKPAS